MNTVATVLAVDDNPLVLDGIVEYLRGVGFCVVSALRGRDGLDLAFRSKPDVVVCDYFIPDLDGLSILRVLRQAALTTSIPFVMLSSRADMRVQRELGQFPVTAYVDKCTGICDLVEAIRRLLQSTAPSLVP
jgi:CheY-like chemotaxis protein